MTVICGLCRKCMREDLSFMPIDIYRANARQNSRSSTESLCHRLLALTEWVRRLQNAVEEAAKDGKYLVQR